MIIGQYQSLPILAICGWKNSGKTTLLEALIPELRSFGLKVAVVKHDAHGIQVDRPGKDSDRLFQAGANVVLQGPGESFHRIHRDPNEALILLFSALLHDHDLVLVEGHKATPLPKIWLVREDKPAPPPEVTDIVATLPWGPGRKERLLDFLQPWLAAKWAEWRLFGGLLIGGKSTRMGTPKHLLSLGGGTYFDHIAATLKENQLEVVVLGCGDLPPGAPPYRRIPDSPGLAGPLAGILAAMRWAPHSAWVLAACDLPHITAEAVRWLLEQRRPGCWAVLPRVGTKGVEPLLALYEPQARLLLEDMATQGLRAPKLLAEHPNIATPIVPPELARSWTNINSPEDCEQRTENSER